MNSDTPLLDAIRKIAANTSGQVALDKGFTSGLNKELSAPPTSDIKKTPVAALQNAYKVRGSSSSGSLKGPQATTGMNTPNVTNYKPSLMGVRM